MAYNVDVDESDGITVVSVNPKVYSMDAIYAAAYAITDRAYVYVTGDPDKEIFVVLTPKFEKPNAKNLRELGLLLDNYLISFQAYYTQAKYVAQLRELMLQQAAATEPPIEDIEDPNKPSEDAMDKTFKAFEKDKKYNPDIARQFIIHDESIDPEGISIPWEEKYGGYRKQNH